MAKGKTIRPSYYDDEDDMSSDEEFTYSKSKSKSRQLRSHDDSDDDELSSISFGALNRAQSKLLSAEEKEDDGEEESSDEFFEDSDSDGPPEETSSHSKNQSKKTQKKNKHAPAEASSKRPVSKIRDIPGLPSRRDQTLHTDIRFDAAYGKADLRRARKDYAFLDEYRALEIANMEAMLREDKKKNRLNDEEREEMKVQLQSLKSRMDTLKNRDLEEQVLKGYKKQQMDDFKAGKVNKPFFLKRSDKRKILQKAKFDSMKPKQREKAMERKRKKRLGKEFKQLEFRSSTR
ncbi:rRNA biogenesis protein RRP36 [Candida viswanathii]|uniref:rRNA biogenesis protein RRP36 n=1 Tax=Candida viswanathii TaxID=5486 RepID=A0A367YC56_9ASCO|nr:rRNA biogenesis protein RRP36 [Candida viswanathii]